MKLKKIENQLYLYVLLLPILDMIKFLLGNSFEFFGISIVEIVNLCFGFYLAGAIVYKKIKNKEKISILSIIAIIISIIYIILHFINIQKFSILFPDGSKNLLVELYYIIRAYVLPFSLLYASINIDKNADKTIKILSFISFFICLIIVVSNIFKIGFVSYDSYLIEKSIIKGNIFDWASCLTNNNADLYTSKGFFYSSNQLSLILCALFGISLYYLQKAKKPYLFISFIIKILGMIMISTKTSLIGIIILLLFAILVNFIFYLIKKDKFDIKLNLFILFCIVLTGVLFTFSPVSYKIGYNNRNSDDINNTKCVKNNYFIEKNNNDKDNNVDNNANEDNVITEIVRPYEGLTLKEEYKYYNIKFSSKNLQEYIYKAATENLIYFNIYNKLNEYELYEVLNKNDYTDEEREFLILTIDNCNSYFGIHENFVGLFPVKENLDFWIEFIRKNDGSEANFRKTKLLLYEYTLDLNKNKLKDLLFGIGYISGFPYTETDVVGQNVWFGLFGLCIFVLPLYVLFLYNCWLFIRNLKKNFTKLNCYLLFSSAFMLFISIKTGHCFGNIFPMTILIVILTLNQQLLRNEEMTLSVSDDKKKILFIIWSYSMGGGAEKVLTNIVNNLDDTKYSIDILEYWHVGLKKEKVNSNINILKPIIDVNNSTKIERIIKKLLVEMCPYLLRRLYVRNHYDYEISFNYLIPTFLLDKKAKCISWIHGDIYDLKANKYQYFLQKRAFKKVKKIVTISKNTYNSIKHVFPSEVHKLEIINNGLDLEEIEKLSKEKKMILKNKIFVFLGRLDENKNPILLIEIAKKLKEKNLDYQILVLGTGNLYNKMKEMIKEFKLDKYIKLKGYINNPYPYILSSTGLLLCSKSEGFPTVLLEGIMLDTPFVSTNVGGVDEMANKYQCGVIATTEDEFLLEMKTMVENRDFYEELVDNCKKTKKLFTLEKQIKKIEKIIDNMQGE